MRSTFLLCSLMLALSLPARSTNAFSHQVWDELLQKHVVVINNGHATVVDYAGFAANKKMFQTYLNALSAVTSDEYETWTKDKQLAFLINAYNAFTVELILTKFPDIESIRDLGSFLRSPWKKDFISLLGDLISLDDIEHGMIRAKGVFDDPRIHFAVNCASIGCPALRNEAYTESLLQEQLEHQTMLFLTDRSRNYAEGNSLYLSSIFEWYKDDFSTQFFTQYADALGLNESQTKAVSAEENRFRYLKYNWSLNKLE